MVVLMNPSDLVVDRCERWIAYRAVAGSRTRWRLCGAIIEELPDVIRANEGSA